jgi:hypothetical protein
MTARIGWSLTSNYSAAAHPPKVVVNESSGYDPLILPTSPGATISLDASESIDVDTNSSSTLDFQWSHYRDITLATTPNWLVHAIVPQLNITCVSEDCGRVQIKMPEVEVACLADDGSCQVYHIILAAKTSAETPLTRYKRVILDLQKNVTMT